MNGDVVSMRTEKLSKFQVFGVTIDLISGPDNDG